MLKLLIIVRSIDGGTGTFVLSFLELNKFYANKKIEINYLIFEKPTFRKVKSSNFSYLRPNDYYPDRYSFSINNVLDFIKEVLWSSAKIRLFKPDIIMSVDLRCNLVTALIKVFFFKNIKIVATNHINLRRNLNDKSSKFLNFLLRKSVSYIYGRVDVVVSVSKKLSKSLRKEFKLRRKIITIYNGVEAKAVTKRSLKQKKKIIITVSRLVEQKDNETLINAFDLAQRELHDCELWIIGDGPEKSKLKRIAANLNLSKKIKFFGWNKNLDKFYKESDLFVLSSRREGFAYVLVEAMVEGLPVVSTNTPFGPSEILDKGKYGVLVPVGNKFLMKEAIVELLTNKNKYTHFSEKSLERCTFFSKETMLKNYLDIFENLK